METVNRVHGTMKSYWNGCRCDDCRAASAEYRQRRRQTAGRVGGCIDDLYNTLTEIVLDRQAEWRRHAACSTSDTPVSMFFARRGDNRTVQAAKQVCATCPVTDECRNYMLTRSTHRLGIWAGESAHQQAVAGRRPSRPCDNCGTVFTQQNTRTQRFCSRQCRRANRSDR